MTDQTLSFDDWLNAKLLAQDRESYLGYHYIYSFLHDPYGWYLRYVRGLRPVFTKPALLLGGALHTSIEAAYLHRTTDAALTTFRAIMAARKREYEDQETHADNLTDGLAMLERWCATWLDYDIRTYHLLHIEEQFELPLANGYIMTVKPDLIVQSKTDGELRILDHKSTQWSIPKAHASLEGTDQSTCYIWAVRKLYPRNRLIGLESDILYKNKSVVNAQRVGIIQRTDAYIAEWELSTISILQDIARRVLMLNEGYPPSFCFPRNSFAESYFGAEWPLIYRAPLPEDPHTPPYGYTIDTWAMERGASITALALDPPKEVSA